MTLKQQISLWRNITLQQLNDIMEVDYRIACNLCAVT